MYKCMYKLYTPALIYFTSTIPLLPSKVSPPPPSPLPKLCPFFAQITDIHKHKNNLAFYAATFETVQQNFDVFFFADLYGYELRQVTFIVIGIFVYPN